MVVPSLTRGFAAAAHASPTTGSSTGPVRTSDSQIESKRSSSMLETSSPSAAGVAEAPAAPTPMRIFMAINDTAIAASAQRPRPGMRRRRYNPGQEESRHERADESSGAGAGPHGADRGRGA